MKHTEHSLSFFLFVFLVMTHTQCSGMGSKLSWGWGSGTSQEQRCLFLLGQWLLLHRHSFLSLTLYRSSISKSFQPYFHNRSPTFWLLHVSLVTTRVQVPLSLAHCTGTWFVSLPPQPVPTPPPNRQSDLWKNVKQLTLFPAPNPPVAFHHTWRGGNYGFPRHLVGSMGQPWLLIICNAVMVNQRRLGLQGRFPIWAPVIVSQVNKVRKEVLSFGNNMNKSTTAWNPMESGGHSSIKCEAGRVCHRGISKSCSRSVTVLGMWWSLPPRLVSPNVQTLGGFGCILSFLP